MSKTLTKQELKAPDEFHTLGNRAAAFAAKNPAMAIVAALVPLLVVGGIFAMSQQSEQREVAAASKLFAGEKLLAPEGSGQMKGLRIPGFSDPKPDDLRGAIGVFQDVAREFPGSKAERRAHLLAGDSYLTLKDYDGAVKEFEAASGAGTEMERYYALSGKGHALEGKQAWDDAAGAYRRIVDDATMLNRDLAALDLSRVLVKAGKPDDAKAVLGKFGTDFPNSAMKSDADAKLAALGGTPAPVATATPGKPEAN